MLWSKPLNECQKIIENEFEALAKLIITGKLETEITGREITTTRETLKSSLPKIDGEETSINGYLWLNLKLMEDLVNLKRLLIYSLNLSQE